MRYRSFLPAVGHDELRMRVDRLVRRRCARTCFALPGMTVVLPPVGHPQYRYERSAARTALARTIGWPWPNCYGVALRCEEGKDVNDRAFASATELSEEIRDRRIGCVELLDFYLARAERQNPD